MNLKWKVNWKRKGRNFFVLLCFLGTAIFVCYFSFVHTAWQEKASEYKEKQRLEEQEILTVMNYMNAHSDFKSVELAEKKRNLLAKKAIPENLEQGNVLLLLQSKAMEHEIALVSVMPEKCEENTGMSKLPIEVRFQCGYFDLLDFLKDLQEDGRFLQIQGFQMKSKQGRLDCRMKVIAFAMKS